MVPFYILFEDSNYIAISKPCNMPVHATLDKNRENVVDLLQKQISISSKLFLVHRLDKDTSGVLIFAKNKDSNKFLANLFASHNNIDKKYLGIIHGTLSPQDGMMEDYLKKITVNKIQRMQKVNSGGQKAISNYKTINSTKNNIFSLVEFHILTGRMHQIRVQSSLRNTPLLGDTIYGIKDNASRLMLHSLSLSFFDIFSNTQITINSEIPPEFNKTLAQV